MGEVFRGVKAGDWLLAGVLTLLGLLLMLLNVSTGDADFARSIAEGSAFHRPGTAAS